MHSASFFKTKRSNVVLRLKSVQEEVVCNKQEVKQIQKMQFYKVEAARRAISTKKTIVIFQDRGRPQSNINRKDNRDCSKSKLGPIHIDLHIEFGTIFYAILNCFDPCVSLDPSKLSGKLDILMK